jgi:hypothetical protein
MGLPDYLGWEWKSTAGIPIVCLPGCPVQPDNFTQTLLYLLHQAAGHAPMIPLDEMLRPAWLFAATVHEGCDRGGYYEQGEFAEAYGAPQCIVKLGCWGPVVQCNVGKRGWMNGLGGCPNVGGICIGCTMPGFPDKFMPFMDPPPGSLLSSHAVKTYGRAIHALRRFTLASMNKEPSYSYFISSGRVLLKGGQSNFVKHRQISGMLGNRERLGNGLRLRGRSTIMGRQDAKMLVMSLNESCIGIEDRLDKTGMRPCELA